MVPYLIRVDGCLGPTLLTAFPALTSERQGRDTVLTGELPDSSALYGVLAEPGVDWARHLVSRSP